jgi:hypothetical protein
MIQKLNKYLSRHNEILFIIEELHVSTYLRLSSDSRLVFILRKKYILRKSIKFKIIQTSKKLWKS